MLPQSAVLPNMTGASEPIVKLDSDLGDSTAPGADNLPTEADETLLSDLISMGFPGEDARKALIKTGNRNVQVAIDMMMQADEPKASPASSVSSSAKIAGAKLTVATGRLDEGAAEGAHMISKIEDEIEPTAATEPSDGAAQIEIEEAEGAPVLGTTLTQVQKDKSFEKVEKYDKASKAPVFDWDNMPHMPKAPPVAWIAIGSVLFLVVILLLASLRTVPPATVGMITTAGSVWERTLPSGVHFTSPIAKINTLSTKTILLEDANHVPTKEGLSVQLDVSVLYHINASRARDIYLELGTDYAERYMIPHLSSLVRGLTSEQEAKALYTEGRTLLQDKLTEELASKMAPRGIEVEDVLLKAVRLPRMLVNAIELKAQAEQESERMVFVLEKERQEAQRKAIEARGIADFQRIVSTGITPDLLQWKGIEATEHLAMSINAKIVLMGNTEDSLPVLFAAGSD